MAREPDASLELLDAFIDLSAELTGFTRSELQGTGLAAAHCREVLWICGETCITKLIGTRPKPVEFFEGATTAPLARRIIFLWYTGRWDPLPDDWLNEYGGPANKDGGHSQNTARVISAAAYREGLVWRAIGVNPMGAKHPGFGAWEKPP